VRPRDAGPARETRGDEVPIRAGLRGITKKKGSLVQNLPCPALCTLQILQFTQQVHSFIHSFAHPFIHSSSVGEALCSVCGELWSRCPLSTANITNLTDDLFHF
jgi:hypothetical protein